MSDEKPKSVVATPPTPPPVTMTKDQIISKLKALQTEAELQSGSPYFNPHLWARNNIQPLRNDLMKGATVTVELVAKVNALKVPTEAENKAAFQKRNAP